jgi:hypothetical protein
MDIYPAAAELIRDVRVIQLALDVRPHAGAFPALRLSEVIPSKITYAKAKTSPGAPRTFMAAHLSQKRA